MPYLCEQQMSECLCAEIFAVFFALYCPLSIKFIPQFSISKILIFQLASVAALTGQCTI